MSSSITLQEFAELVGSKQIVSLSDLQERVNMKGKNTGSAKPMGAKTDRKSDAKTPSKLAVAADKVKQNVKGRKSPVKATQK